jgi:hypothetical protein
MLKMRGIWIFFPNPLLFSSERLTFAKNKRNVSLSGKRVWA